MSFSTLPSEIRFAIYTHLMPSSEHGFTTSIIPLPDGTSRPLVMRHTIYLPILRVSKQISLEVQHLLYTNGKFHLCIERDPIRIPAGFFDDQASSMMREVIIDVCADPESSWLGASIRPSVKSQYRKIIDRLRTLQHPFRICQIWLHWTSELPDVPFAAEQLCEPLKVLVDFERVIIKVMVPHRSPSIRSRNSRGQQVLALSRIINHPGPNAYEKVRFKANEILESVLGFGTLYTDVRNGSEEDRGDSRERPEAYRLEFEPKKHATVVAMEE